MHLSLKGSLDRQPLTDRLGDRLLAEYGGAAAAYSLRALNGNGDNVVRVRRASDNSEQDFTASQVSSGDMVNWVNAQIVPPLDIRELDANGERTGALVEAAAAYSLRNLSASYTGNVVDVRRSSDDAEASFTAEEVSDGTLEDWVNEDVTIYQSDFSSGLDGFIVDAGGTAIAGQTFAGALNVVKHTPSTSTSGSHRIRRLSTIPVSSIVSLRLLVYIPSSNTVSNGVEIRNVAGELSATTNTTDEWVVVEVTGTTGSEGSSQTFAIHATSEGSRFFTGNGTDVIYYKNASVTVTSADGFVTQWYDQSGNANHATQGTPASQPKIVDGGALVAGDNGKTAIKFDGVDDSLNCGARVVELSQNPATVFAVSQKDGGTGENLGYTCSEGDAVSPYSSNFIFGSDNGGSVLWVNATNFGVGGDGQRLESFEWDQVNFQAYVNGAASGAAGGATVNIETSNTIIGAAGDQLRAFSARKITELISYKSDQSSNRTAIEANIGETYGIDLPSGVDTGYDEVDGFVETWYDQSGNGNDATQATIASQPKIVDAGSLVSGGLDFDGVDDFLNFTEIDFSTNSWMLSAVVDWDGTSFPAIGSSTSQWLLLIANNLAFTARSTSDNTIHNFVPTGNISTGNGLFITERSSDTLSGYYNGIFSSANPAITASSEFKATRIGLRGSVYGSSAVKEIIIYDTDQSSNRTAIETNINNHYNIYA